MRDHRGLLSRAEGCGTFDARDWVPRSSRLTAHPPTTIAENVPAATPVLPRERVRSSALSGSHVYGRDLPVLPLSSRPRQQQESRLQRLDGSEGDQKLSVCWSRTTAIDRVP